MTIVAKNVEVGMKLVTPYDFHKFTVGRIEYKSPYYIMYDTNDEEVIRAGARVKFHMQFR